jgi:hypothetical protein
MNTVFTPTFLICRTLCVVVMLMAGMSAVAQTPSPYRQLQTAKDIAVADTVAGLNLDLNLINPTANHGTVSLNIISPGGGGNPYVHRILYTPDPGFVGVDTFALEFNYAGSYPYLIYRAYQVTVFPSLLSPKQDFATTQSGTSISINVLANDIASNLPLSISSIPAVDNGTAVINGNNIVFTPESGYAGTAHFNYVVCDALGYCKTASASIGVHTNPNPINDTVQVFTAKNTPVSHPLLHAGYTLFQAPTNGTLSVQNGQSFRYSPTLNFSGNDQFVLVNNTGSNTVYKTVNVSVLGTPTQNMMAVDDYIYTPRGQAITFNVRTNDIGNLLVKGWTIPTNLPGTVSGTSGSGNCTFTPHPNFTGVATFYYKLGNMQIPDLEVGTVHVIVSNQPPSAGLFELTTPTETPLVINYKVPFIGWNFTVTDAPDHGTCTYHPGYTTQTYGSQSVSGQNLLVYTPSSGYIGTDEFEIRYCINGNCQTVKISVNVTQVLSANGPYCIGDHCVWAGDANQDGIVNNRDLLQLGYCMGMQGNVRPNAALEWFGQFGPAWNNPFAATNIDLKHADTDGNGIVTAEDTLALGLFYGQQSRLTPQILDVSKGLPFFVNFLNPGAGVGDLVEIEIMLGNAATPATYVYGYAFDAQLSPQIVDSAFQMTFYDNSWVNQNAPYLTTAKRPRVGRFETAFTRTNGVSASGYGLVAKLDFIIVDVVNGARPNDLSQAQPLSITLDGGWLDANGSFTEGRQTITLPNIRPRSENVPVQVSSDDLKVYPSPANGQVQIHLNGTDLIEELTVLDMAGRTQWQANGLQTEHAQVDVSGWANGLYIVVARTQSGNVSRKFEVLR